MFTGIVEEIGQITDLKKGSDTYRVTISCHTVLEGLQTGDSVAVNGVCLTASAIYANRLAADVMVETLARSSIGMLKVGSLVNLERALKLGGRLGGHFVTGHIDGVGRIISVRPEGNSLWYEIKLPDNTIDFMVPKGSIAIDGTSLTIAYLNKDCCTVSLIPHTAKSTILGSKKAGDKVNIEADILGKYVVRNVFGANEGSESLTIEKLRGLGFA